MATEVPLSWKLSVRGATEVKTKLAELQRQFDQNAISAEDYAKGLREVARDSTTFTNSMNLQNRVFLATHPNLQRMSRAMSTVASVSRTLLTITNALNLARIASQGISSEQLDIESQIAQTLRAIARETDPEKLQALNEQLAVLRARLQELVSAETEQKINNLITLIGSVGLAVGGISSALAKIGGSGLLAGIGAGAVAGFAALAVAILAAVAAVGVFIAIWERLTGVEDGFFTGIVEQFSDVLGPFTKEVIRLFTITIPRALGTAAVFLTQFFLEDLPTWAQSAFDFLAAGFTGVWAFITNATQNFINAIVTGIEFLINQFINAVNVMIRAYNAAARKIGLPTISELKQVTLARISLETPEAKTAAERDIGLGGDTGAGATVVNNFEVHGSIRSDQEFMKLVDDNLKQKLKTRGFKAS
jgi:hypothetical protein